MKEPKRIPLNPDTPKAYKPKSYPLKSLYPETMDDDLYFIPKLELDDSTYIPIENENNSQDNSQSI